jgi:NAD(P)-dependent dehydrogenase (short-subunit alcohol dehydrogenase family)
MRLEGKAALVTGASKGLGAALARELARRGAKVGLVARSEEALETIVAEIRAAGGEAYALPADIADKRDVHPLAGAAAAVLGSIDVVVHNASALGPTPLRLLLDTDCEDLAAVLETNLVGPFRLTKILAGSMALRNSGVVVQVSSDAAVAAYPRWGAYSISKAASDHLGRILAAELEGLGVRVFSVDPGDMDTEMHAQAVPDANRAELADPAVVARKIAAMIEGDSPRSGTRVEAARWEASP